MIHVHVGFLEEPQKNVFNVFSDVARFGEGGGVSYRKGNIEHLGQGLSEQCFPATRWTNEKDVALVQTRGGFFRLSFPIPLPSKTFVVVVHRYRHHLFGCVLTNHLLVEKTFDLEWFGD